MQFPHLYKIWHFGGTIMEKITLHWYGPYDLSNIENHDVTYENGIYAIYRIWGNSQKLLYIGKTERNFIDRIKEHYRNWVGDLRGKVKVRFGILELDKGKRFSKKRLADVESLLILKHQPPENEKSKSFYYGRKKLEILNTGRRGLVDRKVSTIQLV
jgi:hypothetical protein